jgi:hypothetical protein
VKAGLADRARAGAEIADDVTVGSVLHHLAEQEHDQLAPAYQTGSLT